MKVYAFRSELKSIMTYDEMQEICILSAWRNRKDDVTGFMIECGGIFLQAFEGPDEAVNSVFRRISVDVRHHHIDLLMSNEGVSRRQFGAWAMNLMFMDDPLFWRKVVGSLSTYDDFLQQSRDPIFSLGLLAHAYKYACSVAGVDPTPGGEQRGRIPRARDMLGR